MEIIKKLKCAIGLHKPKRWHYSEKYPFRTTNKGRSKKRWHTVKVYITEIYCENCGKVLKRNKSTKW